MVPNRKQRFYLKINHELFNLKKTVKFRFDSVIYWKLKL